jgi:hypothetical protein
MAIGEASVAFIFVFMGIICQLPYYFSVAVFTLNGLPKTKLSSDWYCAFYGLGLLSSVITGVASSMVLVAGANAATTSAVWICVFTFLVVRVICQSLWPLSVLRVLISRDNKMLFMPVNSTRSLIFVGVSWLLHIAEFILVAFLAPHYANLVTFTPFYMYIPELFVHTVLTAVLLIKSFHPGTLANL